MTFDEFQKMMSFDTNGKFCIEILFSVKESEKFNQCWMGKMPDQETKNDIYWFGLTPDGTYAFDYSTFEEFASVGVFDGKSLFQIWDVVVIKEIDGCDPKERLDIYLSMLQ